MENTKTVSEIFAEMDNLVSNFFGECKKFANEIEERKMIFVINRTEHYAGTKEKGVSVIECLEFDGLARYGLDIEKQYPRGRFCGDYGRETKAIKEMNRGTILKLDKGEYIQRIK